MRTLVFVVFVLSTGTTYAAGGQGAREMFRQLDRNGDRVVQFSELHTARAELFLHIDTNGDGILGGSELHAAAGQAEDTRGLALLRQTKIQMVRMDSSGDGRISREEFVTFLPDRVLRADVNNDGELSVAELRAILQ